MPILAEGLLYFKPLCILSVIKPANVLAPCVSLIDKTVPGGTKQKVPPQKKKKRRGGGVSRGVWPKTGAQPSGRGPSGSPLTPWYSGHEVHQN